MRTVCPICGTRKAKRRCDRQDNKAVACQKELDVAGAVRAYRKVIEVGKPEEAEVNQAKIFLKDIAAAIGKNDGIDLDAYLASQDAFNRVFPMMEQGQPMEVAGFECVEFSKEQVIREREGRSLSRGLFGKRRGKP